jgi:anti-sigma-K factor RskA
MLEDLLGFLIGALDEEELERLSRALDGDAELQRQVALLRDALLPLELCNERFETPVGLAARTWVVVRESVLSVSETPGPAGASPPGGDD